MGAFHGVYPNKLDISTGYSPYYSPVFVKDRSCRTSDLKDQKRSRISVRQKRLLTHLQKAEFSIEFHHIYLPWGWVKSLNAQEWDVAYDPKKWTQHQCYPGFYILEQSFSHGSWHLSGNPSAAQYRWEPPAGAHPSIQSIHASTESTHLSSSIHRFPSHNVPKYSLRIPGSWRLHRHGGKTSTPCSSGSSLSELDLGDKHSIA